MQSTSNVSNAATAAALSSLSIPNAKAIGLFNKISGGRKPGTSAASSLVTPTVTQGGVIAVSRLNERTVLADNHFPDFFQTVRHTKPQKKKFTAAAAASSATARGSTVKWTGNNEMQQSVGPAPHTGRHQPINSSATGGSTRRQTTIVDKSKVAVKLDTWKDVKNSSDQAKLLHRGGAGIGQSSSMAAPERPSTAGGGSTSGGLHSFQSQQQQQQTSNNHTTHPLDKQPIKGYVRAIHDRVHVHHAPSVDDDAKASVMSVSTSQTQRTRPRGTTDQSGLRPSANSPPPPQIFGADTSKPEPAMSIVHTIDKSNYRRAPVVDKDADNADVCFGETPDVPGVPVVYRSQRAKTANPERLNLDRRALKVVPLLDGEHMLRLLNLQNNTITAIGNLHGLLNLIFLDLYNNKIEKIDNLHVVPNLRVLMLGKNKLQTIENLACLPKLDVLDLHSNEIDKIECLDQLNELRVLNLAGNRITVLENISTLTLLTELNLRRNLIDAISTTTLGRLPTLQRLFLSNNKLPSKESLQPLFQLVALTELRLDGNKFNEVESPDYRSLMIQNFVSLRNLDLKAVTDDERRDAFSLTQKATEKRREQQREENQEAQRVRAITAVRKKWEEKFDMDVMAANLDDPWGATPMLADKAQHMSMKRLLAATATMANHASHPIQIGFSEVEVSDESRTLFVYGDALEALDSVKIHAIVTAIVFKYIPFDVIAKAVSTSNSTCSNNVYLQSFTALKHVHFAYNQLTSLDQLHWVAGLGSRAEEVTISHNPVCHLRLLRPYVSHTLKNVQVLNGQPLSLETQLMGERFFDMALQPPHPSPSSVPRKGPPQQPLPPMLRQGSCAMDRTTNALISKYLTEATRVDEQLKYMNDKWHSMVYDVIKETLEEVEDMDKYMSKCLDRL